LTQEALAAQLGVSGKAVISGWETGRTSCEGPAAELLLRIAVGNEASNLSVSLEMTAEAAWRRSGTWADTWRQVCAVPDAAADIERDVFATLFPGAEIPPKAHVHGFPFVSHGLPSTVFGLGPGGWAGTIPVERDRSPQYLWQLTRNAAFLYREVPWELAKDSITSGDTHIGSLLEIAAATTFFLQRLALKAKLDAATRYTLYLDLEGMRDRGLVGASEQFDIPDRSRRVSPEAHMGVSVRLPLSDIVSDPLAAAFALVGELALLLRPDLATTAALRKQLRARVSHDRRHSTMRFLGFVDDLV
jgi:transcriptional regulator with XRE-family HTH domain